MATLDDAIALLEAARDRGATAAPACVMAMAEHYRDVVRDELSEREHAPFSKTPSEPGQPPAMISGDLLGSVTPEPGPSSGTLARATVAPHTDYARVQEEGDDIAVRYRKFLMWKTDYPTPVTNPVKSAREGGGLFLNFAKTVHIPERPYMRPAMERTTRDGSLEEAAALKFAEHVWGL